MAILYSTLEFNHKPQPIISAIIVAAGSGTRFKSPTLPKQFLKINQFSALEISLKKIFEHPLINNVSVVVSKDFFEYTQENILSYYKNYKNYENCKNVKLVLGGATRQESVKNAFYQLAPETEFVLIHDAVRPLVETHAITKVIEKAQEHGAAILAQKTKDTLKLEKDNFIVKTINREHIWQAQTPQVFKYEFLKEAMQLNLNLSDEAALVEKLNKKIYLVENNSPNLKLTEKEDFKTIKCLNNMNNNLRVGLGIDVHQLEKNIPLFLGCVHIPFAYGLKGHSDADVLAHALADALLGAANLGDIGEHFSDKDEKWKNLKGSTLLQLTMAKVKEKGYKLLNADLCLLAQEPKISPYKKEMQKNMAQALNVYEEQINIKASTTEHLGFIGKKEGLMAKAVVLLEKL